MTTKILILLLSIQFLVSCGEKKEEKKTEKIPAKISLQTKQAVGIGRVVPEKQIIQLAIPLNGILGKIYKDENQTVKANEVIAELINEVEQANLTESVSKLSTQQQQVKIEEAGLEEYSSKLTNAKKEYERLKALYEKGAETKQMVENAETNYKSLQGTIDKLQQQIGGAKKQLVESKANIAVFKSKLEQTKIKSPYEGKILEWKIRPGEGVIALQAVAQIAPIGNTIVESEVDESLASKIQLGQLAAIRYLGQSNIIAKGKVYFISDYLKKKSLFSEQSGELEDRRVRVVKILLNNAQGVLLNSKVETIIYLK